MKKTPLRRRSKITEKWARLYSAELANRLKRFSTCQRCGYKQSQDGHHFAGSRRGKNILRFVVLCRNCHDSIHAHPNAARDAGWLAYVNGYLHADNDAVAAAEKRYAELMEQLTEKGGG